ncbi:MAG: hypothetical protein D3909_12675, partial [Candidatus Electrothrix sp. ATG1]|nr:hypothetical protein [Candidatus Electrothrix sp. ATG1]
MISIKNNLWQLKESDHVLIELVFFIVKVVGLVFLLYLAAGGLRCIFWGIRRIWVPPCSQRDRKRIWQLFLAG